MKSSLIAFGLLSVLSNSAFASTALKLNMDVKEVLTLKKISNTRFEKISNSATGTAALDVIVEGETKSIMKQAINESDSTNAISMEITGKNILRITDQKENIDQEVQAEIDKKFFGGLNSITIKSKTLEALYSESLKKSGIDVLQGLNISGKINLATEIIFSDQVCIPDGDLLICNQDTHVGISIAD